MRTSETVDLVRVLERAQLAALPQSAIHLIQLSQDADNGPAEFAVPIESDPGLAGQVLRFVNSSYFGFRQEVSSVKLAISLVGVRTIKNFAMWSAVFSLMPNPRCGPFDLRRLWQDSLRRAVFARAFGRLLGLAEAEDLFAAALLQDMAVPLLANELPGHYRQLLEARASGRSRLSDLERELFGWTHAQAGSLLARRWGLPEAFAALVDTHTESPDNVAQGRITANAAAVALSSLMPSECDEEWSEQFAFEELYGALLGQRAPLLAEFFARVDRDFADFAPLLKVATPPRSLVDSLTAPHAGRLASAVAAT